MKIDEKHEKKGFFSRILSRKKPEASEITAQPEPEEVVPTAEPVVEKIERVRAQPRDAVFEQLEGLWKENTDPLYVRKDLSELTRECYLLVKQADKEESNLIAEEAREAREKAGTDAADKPKPPPKPVNGKAKILVSQTEMVAWIYLFPPRHEGKPASMKDILAALAKNGIKHGILTEELNRLVNNPVYREPFVIAKGELAKDGVDGSVTEHFKREMKTEFVEDENGRVDYKNLNNLQIVAKGDVICDIVPAIHGKDGITVKNHPERCGNIGKDPTIPSGRNTVLSEDKTKLLAEQEGRVVFRDGLFHVDAVLQIPGNVDGTTGNLDFVGDIIIRGDVRNGFTVKANGNVSVQGAVEGATIISDGDITISRGVLGGQQAKLEAGGDLRCKYLENAQAQAKGDIYAENIINSNVKSNSEVVVTSGRGTIIGGCIVASKLIRAKVIGCQASRYTELILGWTPNSVDEEQALERELKQLRHNLVELGKNITYLESSEKTEKKELLEKLKIARAQLAPREQELVTQIEELRKQKVNLKDCRVFCNSLFPTTKIQIGTAFMQVQEEYDHCNVYLNSEGDVVIGNI